MRFLFLSSLRVSLLALITASGFLMPCNKVAAQELNARITINHSQIQGTDNAVFDELQQTLTQFVNDRQWTALQFQKNERIPCSFNITVTKYDKSTNMFTCKAVIQATGTASRMTLLDDEARVREIAQMLSGSEVTQAAVDNARELIEKGKNNNV